MSWASSRRSCRACRSEARTPMSTISGLLTWISIAPAPCSSRAPPCNICSGSGNFTCPARKMVSRRPATRRTLPTLSNRSSSRPTSRRGRPFQSSGTAPSSSESVTSPYPRSPSERSSSGSAGTVFLAPGPASCSTTTAPGWTRAMTCRTVLPGVEAGCQSRPSTPQCAPTTPAQRMPSRVARVYAPWGGRYSRTGWPVSAASWRAARNGSRAAPQGVRIQAWRCRTACGATSWPSVSIRLTSSGYA